ncbi:MAG: hypothetical protein K2J48_09750 [Muribaculaceae bacterium]|nr:hypothetical protein [Muribaculaceae bacterium]
MKKIMSLLLKNTFASIVAGFENMAVISGLITPEDERFRTLGNVKLQPIPVRI